MADAVQQAAAAAADALRTLLHAKVWISSLGHDHDVDLKTQQLECVIPEGWRAGLLFAAALARCKNQAWTSDAKRLTCQDDTGEREVKSWRAKRVLKTPDKSAGSAGEHCWGSVLAAGSPGQPAKITLMEIQVVVNTGFAAAAARSATVNDSYNINKARCNCRKCSHECKYTLTPHINSDWSWIHPSVSVHLIEEHRAGELLQSSKGCAV
eukprot:3939763-Rhodomonas_salina.1